MLPKEVFALISGKNPEETSLGRFAETFGVTTKCTYLKDFRKQLLGKISGGTPNAFSKVTALEIFHSLVLQELPEKLLKH